MKQAKTLCSIGKTKSGRENNSTLKNLMTMRNNENSIQQIAENVMMIAAR